MSDITTVASIDEGDSGMTKTASAAVPPLCWLRLTGCGRGRTLSSTRRGARVWR